MAIMSVDSYIPRSRGISGSSGSRRHSLSNGVFGLSHLALTLPGLPSTGTFSTRAFVGLKRFV